MKLSFEKTISNDETTQQVYPVVAETGEVIEDVVECSIYSAVEEETQMTITVNIKNGE